MSNIRICYFIKGKDICTMALKSQSDVGSSAQEIMKQQKSNFIN